MNLNYNLKFQDLYDLYGLAKIDSLFLESMKSSDIELYEALLQARAEHIDIQAESELLLKLAPILESFIANLFCIQEEVEEQHQLQKNLEPIFECKKSFIQRRVVKQLNLQPEEIKNKINEAREHLTQNGFRFNSEVEMAKQIISWSDEALLESAAIYAAWALNTLEGKKAHKDSILFSLPKKLNTENLIESSGHTLRNRNGFSLNDDGLSLAKAIGQAKYCIHCHKQGKDSCSKGMVKEGVMLKNYNEIELEGCPLKEKISEMNLLKSIGFALAPLAVAIIDNPMLAATGHRICNDCMKSCIYQKQEPVNIPFVETQTLQDVLDMPYGFEIYSLLTRWNPMNFKQWLPLQLNGYKVLVVGLGPAGFTLSHYLLNQGVEVVAIDGLKIEPLREDLIHPIKNIKDLYEDLNERKAAGFGGVAEYGITVRWNKNYLKIIRLLLERRNHFSMYGGVRFGSNLSYAQAKELGFDHIALAMGAGSPNLLDIPNFLSKGVKTASDFLMNLQLGNAAQAGSLANLQVELPIAVVGGGLTAVDAATEALNYYAAQVERVRSQHDKFGESIFAALNPEEARIAHLFLSHAKELRQYPERKAELLQSWGGAMIVYRKKMTDSPSYKLNHEELEKAMEEGVIFLSNITPLSITTDSYNHCTGITHSNGHLAARTILIAIGTKPNTILAQEDPENFSIEQSYFALKRQDTSVFGDLHPIFHGNVVKAMASAKYGYKALMEKMLQAKALNINADLDDLLLSQVVAVNMLTSNIVEIIVKSKLAVRNFHPGQFYKLQNYGTNSQVTMEPLALTGASVDKERGLLSMIALEIGGSSKLCRNLQVGEAVSLMGPTGEPTFIPMNETVMLVGGGLGNAVLFSIGQAMRSNNCKILYFAGYKKLSDIYKQPEIEKAADVIIWSSEEGKPTLTRDCDYSVHGNILNAIREYRKSESKKFLLENVDRIIVIGSDRMMAAVAHARHNEFKDIFRSDCIAIGSINSPMQCMMKEICAQCLQKHVDKDGNVSYVYSCAKQDQSLDLVDFQCLHSRLQQNSILEKIFS